MTDAPTIAPPDLRETFAAAIKALRKAKREAAGSDEVRAYLIESALRITEHALRGTRNKEVEMASYETGKITRVSEPMEWSG